MPVKFLDQQTYTIERRSSVRWHGADVDGVDLNRVGFQVDIERVWIDLFDGVGTQNVLISRPKSIQGYVWSSGGDSRGDLVPIAELALARMPVTGEGDSGFTRFRMQGHLTYTIGGHLVAVSLTGPDDSRNLLSVCGAFNQEMGKVEARIRNAAAYPQKIRIDVDSYFDDSAPSLPWVPRSVTYHFKEGDAAVSVPITQALMGIQMTIAESGDYTATFNKAKLEMENAGWTVEQADRRFQGGNCLPPIQLRPYAFLDYIAFERKGTYDGFAFDARFLQYYLYNVSKKANFTDVDQDGTFRKIMLNANAATHGTLLTSDAYRDPASVFQAKGGLPIDEHISGLISGGGVNAPEIDHIFPYDQGGANCFSNARLTSKAYNAAKRDIVERLERLSQAEKDKRYREWVAHIQLHFPGQYVELVRQGYI
jgi:hypothetical protein